MAEGAEAVIEGGGFEGGVGDGVGAEVEEGVEVMLVEAGVVRNGVVIEGYGATEVLRLGTCVELELELGLRVLAAFLLLLLVRVLHRRVRFGSFAVRICRV